MIKTSRRQETGGKSSRRFLFYTYTFTCFSIPIPIPIPLPVFPSGHRSARERGVTSLIEIIVIVVILSVLVSATIVSWKGARARVNIRLSCSALLNVRNAMHSYWSEYDEYPAPAASFFDIYTKLSATGLDIDPSNSFRSGSYTYTMVSDTYAAGIDYYTLSTKAKGPRPVLLTITPDAVYANDGKDYADLCR